MDFTPWLPVVQVTLPIIVVIGIAAWLNNKRVDDTNKRIDDVRTEIRDLRAEMKDLRAEMKDFRQALEANLRELQAISANHEKRISVLEERTSPIARR